MVCFIYNTLSVLTGILIAIMIAVNGGLSEITGIYSSSIIIHLVGMLLMAVTMLCKKINPFKNIQPWYCYMGGVMGVFATVGNNYAFEPLGVSALLALGLLGQSVTGLFIDHFGLFGMKVYKVSPMKLLPLSVMFLGVIFMIRQFHLAAMILSFLVGVALVIQRVSNGALAVRTSLIVSTTYTYIIGLIGSIIVFLIFGMNEPMAVSLALPSNLLLYTGGILGISTVVLSTICVYKVPSYLIAVLIFIGQVFTGLIIDSFLIGEISFINLIGGLIVTLGMAIDIFMQRKNSAISK